MIRHPAGTNTITLICCLCREFAQWTLNLTPDVWPLKPVLLAGATYDALRIDALSEAHRILITVFVLRIDIAKTDLKCIDLILADTASENLLATSRGIKAPHSFLADERNRERKILLSDDNDRFVVAFHGNLVLCVIGSEIFLTRRSIGYIIARPHK